VYQSAQAIITKYCRPTTEIYSNISGSQKFKTKVLGSLEADEGSFWPFLGACAERE
jgi:hypothetical protein